jgi:HK97 family phage portal protein
MTFWSRLGAAVRGFAAKDGGADLARVYGPLAPFVEVYGSSAGKAGQSVTVTTSLQVATVLACVRVIAEGIAQAPLKIYRAREDGGSDAATEHPLYRVLYRKPNPWMTSFAFRENMIFRVGLEGNFYAFKNRVGGQVRELIPLQGKVEVKQRSDMSLQYLERRPDGTTRTYAQDDIWHVRGPSWNTLEGMDVLKLAREVISLTMAIEGDQAQLYKNGLRTSGVYSVEGNLTAKQYEDLRKFIKSTQAGGDAHEVLILDRNGKFTSDAMTGVDAQTLESRRLQIEEICRAFRVMPIMVGHSDKTATYASAEQMFIAHVQHTLQPWCERIEQSIDNDLIGDDTGTYYAKFNLNGLQRGAFETRMNGYAKALGSGGSPAWMTQNEIRALEDMNPINGGDKLPQPPAAAAGSASSGA